MPFFERFQELCKQKNTSPCAVVTSLGMSKSNVTGWKNGSSPTVETAVKIAKILQVSISDLIQI